MIQSAAGSSLGKQVISLARYWGTKTISVVRRAEQTAELKTLGADDVICSDHGRRGGEGEGDHGRKGRVGPIGRRLRHHDGDAGRGRAPRRDSVPLWRARRLRRDHQCFRSAVPGRGTQRLGALHQGDEPAGEVPGHRTGGRSARERCDYLRPAVEKFALSDCKLATAKATAPGVTGKIFLVNE